MLRSVVNTRRLRIGLSALNELLAQTISPKDSADRDLVQEFTRYWGSVLVQDLGSLSEDQVCGCYPDRYFHAHVISSFTLLLLGSKSQTHNKFLVSSTISQWTAATRTSGLNSFWKLS